MNLNAIVYLQMSGYYWKQILSEEAFLKTIIQGKTDTSNSIDPMPDTGSRTLYNSFSSASHNAGLVHSRTYNTWLANRHRHTIYILHI